ncbi:YgfZ/GcvT domain-containing protein [Actinomycetospora termitidis]|uniref:Folate-binding protein n=1 Tax=Actinomycetospora termitidis TaxID=3053470 RepID=A0ABT7M361_9PSEU|nr:folate-binding protein [Actinomycetospora sp. Odt1-22]MDL5155101.1 folate-binding protein [Actinomycetospora sp. Odt1-22]
MNRSPLLDTSGAIGHPDGEDVDAPDAAVAAHFGDPFAEQRSASRNAVVVDRSHRGVVVVDGADRLSWLHLLVSQQVADLPEGSGTEGLVLDVQGRVEHHAVMSHVGGRVWLDVEPGTAPALASYLESMTFWSAVTVRDATEEFAVLSLLGPDVSEVLTAAGVELPAGDAGPLGAGTHGGAEPDPAGGIVRRKDWPEHAVDLVVPRAGLVDWWERLRGAGAAPAGLDAFEALRVASLRPRLGSDTDDRTIPHEVGWIGSAVHLSKGCYRGQETVSRVANLGRPPRQMVLLHLSSMEDALPPPGTPVLSAEGGRAVGRIGTAVRHHELGAVALALVKRSAVSGGAELWVADDRDEGTPGPATVDPDSVPPDTGEPPGRAAVRRLQG